MPPPPDEPPPRTADRPPGPSSALDRTSSSDEVPTAALAGGDAAPTFTRDDLVAGRYRIARFIARGGMGEVYEAEDLERGVRVALKTVRPEAEGRSQAAERFKREIQLARQVTHPNVCRIFDLVRHTRASATETEPDVLCLTMELLAGYREVKPPERLVHTESWGPEWPETLNTLVLSEENGKTTMTATMLYPSREARDAALKTGMKDGADMSFDRLAEYVRTMA